MPRDERAKKIVGWLQVVAVPVVVGALLRAWFLLQHPRFGGDSFVYGDLAQNMLLHHVYGFSEEVLRPTLIRLPGYPLFLAACFAVFGMGNYLAVLWLQVVVDLAGCLLLYRLATRWMGERAGRAILWLAVLCPFTASYTAVALTETLSIYAVIVSIYAFDWVISSHSGGVKRLFFALLTGGGLAASVVLRPDQGLLAAVILPAMLWAAWRRRSETAGRRMEVAPVAIASLLLMLPLGLWGLRNWRVFHVVQPLAPRYANDPGEQNPYGFQRWYRTWAVDYVSTLEVYWNYDSAPIEVRDLPGRAFDSATQRQETAALLAQYNVGTSATPALDATFARLAAERVARHPLTYYVELPVARVLNMWLRPRIELLRLPLRWWQGTQHPVGTAVAVGFGLVNLGYLVLAGWGAVRWRAAGWSGRPEVAAAMLAFVVLRSVLLLTLDNSEPRYTLECYPVVILLAGMVFAGRGAVQERG